MYEFQYDYMQHKYGNKAKSYMDRDSFVWEIETDELYTDIEKMYRLGLTQVNIQRMVTGTANRDK